MMKLIGKNYLNDMLVSRLKQLINIRNHEGYYELARSGDGLSSITEPKVERLEGRTESSVITKNGTIVGRLNFLFKDIDNIKLSQIVQKESGAITINIVPEGEWSCAQSDKIMKYVDERIGLDQIDCTISIVTDANIIYTSRNKFNQVVRLNN